MRIDRPEDTATDEVIEDGIGVVLLAVPKGEVEFAAPVEGLGPGERERIGIGIGVGTIHTIKTKKFGAVGGQNGMNAGALVIGEIAFVGPGEFSGQPLCNGGARVGYANGEGLEDRMLDELSANDLPIVRPRSLRS